MTRAYSIRNVLDAKFNTLEFDGVWKEAIGCPERTGSWIIFGKPKQGKTSFAMMLAKYLTRFERVFYNSVEEGLSRSIQLAYERAGMDEVPAGRILLDRDEIERLTKRLSAPKSPNIVIIDSIQFMEMKFSEYWALKRRFHHKLFIFVSHVRGDQPEGSTARRIWRDANVAIRVEGFRAFPTGRYGGEGYIDVDEERAIRCHVVG
jgi:nucleoside-triphosphatase THEP1